METQKQQKTPINIIIIYSSFLFFGFLISLLNFLVFFGGLNSVSPPESSASFWTGWMIYGVGLCLFSFSKEIYSSFFESIASVLIYVALCLIGFVGFAIGFIKIQNELGVDTFTTTIMTIIFIVIILFFLVLPESLMENPAIREKIEEFKEYF